MTIELKANERINEAETTPFCVVVEVHELFYSYASDPGAGFSFPCDPETGEVLEDELHEIARESSLPDARAGVKTGEYLPPLRKVYFRSVHLCRCGSGKDRFQVYDARGISTGFACVDCVEAHKRKFRPDIFEDSNYWSDEPIEPEPGVVADDVLEALDGPNW